MIASRVFVLALAEYAYAQSCSNYGTALSNGTCACPSGITGTDCSSLACADPLSIQSSRPALSANASSAGCGSQCTNGFSGLNCNICQSAQACQAAFTAAGGTTPAPSSTQLQENNTMTCSNSPLTYTSSFMSCSVQNPTLQAVFPGLTTLMIQKTLTTVDAVISQPSVTNNSAVAQLFYSANTAAAPEEQFYCAAEDCKQVTTDTEDQWHCDTLKCSCVTDSTFCSGALDLSGVFNTLSGQLDINCDSAPSSGSCHFKQDVINTIFGAEGLALSSCSFGECVRQFSIDDYEAAKITASSDSLSHAVIAGLAVLGFIILAIASLLLFGLFKRRKAINAPRQYENTKAAGMHWGNIGYTVAPSGRIGRFLHRSSAPPTPPFADEKLVPLSSMDSDRKSAYPPSLAGSTKHRRILHGLSGSVQPGEFLAIMGPSGAGKSTLVDILAGKRKSGTVTGKVDVPPGIVIGYVDQQDVLPANLTVREALMFAANLKLPENIPKAEKQQRVGEVLAQLSLTDVENSRIGDGERRGISGGERRRVSIGLELIASPSILILDEPTSGLDSTSAMKVVSVLRTLAQEGRTTVISTIHQPSSRIFLSFDQIMVLSSSGLCIYHGSREGVEEWFQTSGLHMPKGLHAADHLLEIATDPYTSKKAADASPTQASSFSGTGPYIRRRTTKPIATAMTQWLTLAQRELINLRRDWSLAVMHLTVAVVVGLFVGGMYWKVDTTIAGFQSRVGSLFFTGALLAFSALSALSNLQVVRPLFLRERSGSYYNAMVWIMSRIVFDIIPLRIVPAIILGTIVYWMVGLAATAAHFFKFLLILVEFATTMTLWNLLLAVVIKQTGISILVSNVVNLASLAYAGFFLNLASIPAALRWIQWINPLKYALEALTVNEISSGLLITDSVAGVAVEVNAGLISKLLFGFGPGNYYRDVLILFGFIGGFALFLLVGIWRLREIR